MSSIIFSLLDTPAYGGAEEYLLTVLFHASTRGHRVVLATNNVQVKEKAIGKIDVIDLPYRLDAIGNWKGLIKYFLALPGALFWILYTIRKFQITICLFPGFTDRLSFSPLVKALGCRLLWLEYGPLEPTFKRNYRFPKLLYALGRPFPDRVITISEWTKQSLITVGKIPANKIQVIYPGVQRQEIRDKRQKKKPMVVVTVARLAKEKEIDLLLQAWKKVDRKNRQLLVIGDGPERAALEAQAQQLGIAKSITFTGFISTKEKEQLLLQADLFVFPSAWNLEGFGMTTLEAMSYGIPVITSGSGPQREIVEDEMSGWYFSPHTVHALAQKIETVLRSSKRARIGEVGRSWVRDHFSSAKMLEWWDDVLQGSTGA